MTLGVYFALLSMFFAGVNDVVCGFMAQLA